MQSFICMKKLLVKTFHFWSTEYISIFNIFLSCFHQFLLSIKWLSNEWGFWMGFLAFLVPKCNSMKHGRICPWGQEKWVGCCKRFSSLVTYPPFRKTWKKTIESSMGPEWTFVLFLNDIYVFIIIFKIFAEIIEQIRCSSLQYINVSYSVPAHQHIK